MVKRPVLFCITVAMLLIGAWVGDPLAATYSSPIAITSDDQFVWVVNRDNDSVSVLQVGSDANTRVAEITVGDEPRCVAITPNGQTVYVTNTVSGNVSVIAADTRQVIKTIWVGAEPFGCALTPAGDKLYVANFSWDTVSVINTTHNIVVKTIYGVGPKPRGIAVTDDGKVYVTQFLAQLRDDARLVEEKEGRDDGKEGRVTVINSQTDSIIGTVVLNPLADTGFRSNGSTLDQIPRRRDANGAEIFDTVTGAFPNLLQGIFTRGNRGYVANTCSSPNGPFRFNVNVQSCLSVFDTATDQDSGQTINMNNGVGFEAVGRRLFITNPIAIAFEHSGSEGWVVSAATNRIVRVQLDATGTPTINAPTVADGSGTAVDDPLGIFRLEVGKNPQGIVINSTDTRAYIMNFISRDVSVIDLAANPPVKLTDIASASLPTATLDVIVQRGHELFNTSIGPAGTQENALPPAGRMSDFGWGSCYGCHPDGLADGVTWMFPDGPRQSISMESTFEHPQTPAFNVNINQNGGPILPTFKQRALNWSAVRDEVQDFELNIRAVSGGQGLIALADGSQDPCVFNLVVPAGSTCAPETAITTGRSADLDAIAAYVAFGIRAPISQISTSPLISVGRLFFEQANCQSCHGGPNWTVSQIDFTPPPVGEQIVDAQLVKFLRQVGTFDPTDPNEFQANTFDVVPAARGVLGFNNPSLLSVFAGAPYFHSGSCQSLECVLENVTHRSAGTPGTDTLNTPLKRLLVVLFLRSIDADTPTFP